MTIYPQTSLHINMILTLKAEKNDIYILEPNIYSIKKINCS